MPDGVGINVEIAERIQAASSVFKLQRDGIANIVPAVASSRREHLSLDRPWFSS